MKLFSVIRKEIRAVKSQRISILLILLYPLLGTLLLGLAMTGTDVTTAPVNIGIISNGSSLTNEIASATQNFNFIPYSDLIAMKNGIKRKEITVGLEIIEQPDDLTSSIVNVHFDNASGFASGIFVDYIKTNIQKIAHEKTILAISDILSTTNTLSTNLQSELGKLSNFRTQLDLTENSLDSLDQKINSFDLITIRDDIDTQQAMVQKYKQKHNAFKSQLVLVRNEYTTMYSNYTRWKNEFNNIKNNIYYLRNNINSKKADLENAIIQLNAMYSQIPPTIQANYLTQLNILDSINNSMSTWDSTLTSIDSSLTQIENYQTQLDHSINQIGTVISQLEQESYELELALTNAETATHTMETQLYLLEQTLNEAKQIILDGKQSKTAISSQLNTSEQLFLDLVPKLNAFKQLNAELIIAPITINFVPVHVNSRLTWHIFNLDPTQIGILVSNAITITLILTCVLLTAIVILLEKSQQIPLRTFMNSASPFTLISGKIGGQLIIAILETIMILVVSVIAFGFPLSTNFLGLTLAILLIGISFIALGLIIGSFTNNQSTAILLSLLLIIPMLFISGIIIPLDLMPPAISFISSFLPLTAANNLLVGVIVKSSSAIFLLKEISALVGISLIGILVTLLKR
ncbi:MAG: ABC transporter permease [Candidatus Diapherotrites archaeon]|jgi:ABC-type multidrug transport system permease subunit|nr:ABC transporter permease [Candidatus Diapherotrites archaeon]